MFENALHACSCKEPKVSLPVLVLLQEKSARWMQNLANNNTSLREMSSTVPHGYRVKNLIEMLVTHQVPLFRAIWFIKALCNNQFKEKVKIQLFF